MKYTVIGYLGAMANTGEISSSELAISWSYFSHGGLA